MLYLGLAIVTILLFTAILGAVNYRKVGPNEVLIVSGRDSKFTDPRTGEEVSKSFSIHHGGGTLVLPLRERVDVMSVELMTLELRTPPFFTKLGVPIVVDAIAQIKVRSDDPFSIATAAEMFLSKTEQEMNEIAHQMMQGHLRAVISSMPFEDIHADPERFAQTVQRLTAADLANMGIQVVSFTIREVQDPSGYLTALGRPQLAEAQKRAQLGEANAERDATVGQAEAQREAATTSSKAKQQARQAAISAELAVASAEAERDLELHHLGSRVAQAKAESDLSYELQEAKSKQQLADQQLMLADLLVSRRDKELQVEIDKPAQAERRRIETLAQANHMRAQLEAETSAHAARLNGLAAVEVMTAKSAAEANAIRDAEVARADGLRAKLLAEAEGRRANLLAEAEGMQQKAAAWKEYGQAALAEQLIGQLPQVAAAVAEPLSRIDRIVLVGGGDGDSGLSKVARGVGDVIAQLPQVIEATTGIDLKALIQPALRASQRAAANRLAETPAPALEEKEQEQVIDEPAAPSQPQALAS